MNQLPRQENNTTGKRIKSWQIQKKNRKRIEKERVLDIGQNLMGAWAKNGTKLDNNLTQLN